jgi:5-methylcytosine-specific restriction enzyme A
MIPSNISTESILKSLEHIDGHGIPNDRHSVKWSLEHDGKLYPPKYVISIANLYENGEEWEPERFSGGQETNHYLENLGFKIVSTATQPAEYPIESHSWKAISDTVVIKVLDKSAFLHHGSGIPRDFRRFFGLEDFNPGERKDITLNHRGNRFSAHFEMDKALRRMRLFWRSDFSNLIQGSLPELHQAFSQDIEIEAERPELRFQKLAETEYLINFINPAEIELDVEAEIDEETTARPEGAAKYSYSKRYERDPVNRRKAIEIHGCVCSVCGFDFESRYGERGKGYIEIHHTKPLSSDDDEVIIDPKTDLIPVCSNCHRMIHRRKDDVLSIENMLSIFTR